MPVFVVVRAVGPNLPLNWWNTLYISIVTSYNICLILISRTLKVDFYQSMTHR